MGCPRGGRRLPLRCPPPPARRPPRRGPGAAPLSAAGSLAPPRPLQLPGADTPSAARRGRAPPAAARRLAGAGHLTSAGRPPLPGSGRRVRAAGQGCARRAGVRAAGQEARRPLEERGPRAETPSRGDSLPSSILGLSEAAQCTEAGGPAPPKAWGAVGRASPRRWAVSAMTPRGRAALGPRGRRPPPRRCPDCLQRARFSRKSSEVSLPRAGSQDLIEGCAGRVRTLKTLSPGCLSPASNLPVFLFPFAAELLQRGHPRRSHLPPACCVPNATRSSSDPEAVGPTHQLPSSGAPVLACFPPLCTLLVFFLPPRRSPLGSPLLDQPLDHFSFHSPGLPHLIPWVVVRDGFKLSLSFHPFLQTPKDRV